MISDMNLIILEINENPNDEEMYYISISYLDIALFNIR